MQNSFQTSLMKEINDPFNNEQSTCLPDQTCNKFVHSDDEELPDKND